MMLKKKELRHTGHFKVMSTWKKQKTTWMPTSVYPPIAHLQLDQYFPKHPHLF